MPTKRNQTRKANSPSGRFSRGKYLLTATKEGYVSHSGEIELAAGVSQRITITMAKALFLNEDLTEAIALGHDLGHTPFGHAGEETLNEICPGGFHHSAQSLRVVDLLEKDGRGLNLTFEVRDGILQHSKGKGEILAEVGAAALFSHEGRSNNHLGG
jgi:dGTP triphosphohydrolase